MKREERKVKREERRNKGIGKILRGLEHFPLMMKEKYTTFAVSKEIKE